MTSVGTVIAFRSSVWSVSEMSVGAAHHALAPPVVDHSMRDLCAWTIKTGERTRCHFEEELRPICCQRGAEAVEHLDRRAIGFFWVLSINGGTALTRTALATRPCGRPWRATYRATSPPPVEC